MKNYLLSVAALLCFSATAQTTIQLKNTKDASAVVANQTVYVSVGKGANVQVILDVKNTGSVTNSYKVKRYDIVLHASNPDTASAYFCFAGNCFGAPTRVSPAAITLTMNQSASEVQGTYEMLTADLDEVPSGSGFSEVKYTFFNIATFADSLQFTIVYNGSIPTGLAKNAFKQGNAFSLYPNPSRDGLAVLETRNSLSRVEVVNLLGSVVLKRDNLSDSKIALDLSNLPSGTYFVQAYEGSDVQTQKLLIVR